MKLKLLSLLFMLAFVSCSKSGGDEDQQPPSLSTTSVSGIANTTAVSGGTVSSQGSSAVTARGVCWSTTEKPTIAGSKTTDGSSTGSFTSNITGLTANTTYYLRAYATNSAGTAYGNELSFTTTNLPVPGSTKEYIVDIKTIFGTQVDQTQSNPVYANVCQEGKYAEFDMDVYAVSYTVYFHDMIITYPGQSAKPHPNATYTFKADVGVEIKNGQEGNYVYTNWFSVGNLGSVTRNTTAKKLYCNVTWCAGNGVCNDRCNTLTGKAKITVQY